MNELLNVKELRTSFIYRDCVLEAVSGISFSINKGDSLGIVGESGSGKSLTSLSIIRLIPKPGKIVSGKVFFNEEDLTCLSDREMRRKRGKDLAMIFQDPLTALNPVLTIGSQIMENILVHEDISKKEASDRTISLLEMVQIPYAKKRVRDYPHQFSGGMRQRVMIAMALSCNPRLLIADEPTTALDVTIQAQIMNLILGLKENLSMSVLLITHNLGLVRQMCRNIAVMYSGTIMEMSPSSMLFANPLHPYTKGLLNSIPKIRKENSLRLVPIEGQPPSLYNRADGCVFHPRCKDIISGRCDSELPSMVEIESGHFVRCFLYY